MDCASLEAGARREGDDLLPRRFSYKRSWAVCTSNESYSHRYWTLKLGKAQAI